MKEEEDIK